MYVGAQAMYSGELAALGTRVAAIALAAACGCRESESAMLVRNADLVQLVEESCAAFADRPALGTKTGAEWTWLTYRALHERIDAARAGLAALGVAARDVVAIVSDNRVEWAVCCYAAYGLEAAFVPMYEAQRPDEWKFILGDCRAEVVITSKPRIFDAITAMRPELPSVRHVIGLELPESDSRSFVAMLRAGAARPTAARRPDPGSTAGLVYTSGTTGRPKGVILSHRNIASDVNAMSEVFPFEPTDRSLSFLPWAHSFGQTAELHYGLSQGISIALNDQLPKLLDNLAEVRPSVLISVPRILNRIYESVTVEMARRPAPLQKMFADAVRSATRRARGERVGLFQRAELALADALIFHRVRAKLGGRLRAVFSAGAGLSPHVAELVDALGIPVYEGYGLTETSPTVCGNTPGHRKLGTVGRPLPGMRVRIDTSQSSDEGRGEIIVYGPNVMQGYHERPEENAKAFTPDGGLRTGDLGFLDADGYLTITGRIKEQYKLENGKYVMPGPLEEELELSPFIANVMLHGANRPYNVALVVPDAAALARWADDRGIALGDVRKDPRVRELLLGQLAERSAGFASFEVPRDMLVVGEAFTTDNDQLTPTLKLKRRNVEARWGAELDALYRKPKVHVHAAPP